MVPTKNSNKPIKKPKVSKKSSSTKVKAIESTGKKLSKKSAPKTKTKYKLPIKFKNEIKKILSGMKIFYPIIMWKLKSMEKKLRPQQKKC